MMATYQPPANLTDFDRSPMGPELRNDWHDLMNAIVNFQSASTPAFYNVLNPPSNDPPADATPRWTGLPRTVKRQHPGSLANAARLVEKSVRMGDTDPMLGRYTPPFFTTSGQVFRGPEYRPQDEYLEWVAKEENGVITEIVFTCEGPEYWDHIAKDTNLLLQMYKEVVGDNSIQLEDLLFPRDVTWANPNRRGRPQEFEKDTYNPYNKWNIQGAVHLTQPANTLGAEIGLAKAASLLYGNPIPVTTDPDLVCCAAYGGINRMSDPTIGSGVNTQVQLGNRVSLRNPIGLYIHSIQRDKFALPDDTPFPPDQVDRCWEPLRPKPEDVTDMIVRARFRVPPGITHNGQQVRVGDLKVNGETIVTGGQVADVVNMTLFALAIPGAPPQRRQPCRLSPCPDINRPELIVPIPFGDTCPTGGVSPLEANVLHAAADRAAPDLEPAESALELAGVDAGVSEDLPKTRFAYTREVF